MGFRSMFFAAAAVLLVLSGARAEPLSIPGLGFQLDAPDGWRLLSRSEEFQIAQGVDLGSDLMNRRVQNVGRTSRLAVVVRDEANPRANPGIFLDVHPGRVDDIAAGLDNVHRALGANVPNYERLTTPELVSLGPYPAGRIGYRYDAGVAAGSIRVEETFWLVPLGESYLTISAGVEAGRDADAMAAIFAAARSLRQSDAE